MPWSLFMTEPVIGGMFVCAGLTGNTISLINHRYSFFNMLKKSIIITSVILVLELVSGYILNIYLELEVWDYSLLPCNFNGQICLYFALIWFFIFSPLIVWLYDAIGWAFFGDLKPYFILYYYLQMLLDILNLFLPENISRKKIVSK